MARAPSKSTLAKRMEAERPAAEAPEPQAIPEGLPESFVRFAVLANRKADPIHTMIINHALVLPRQTGALRTQTIGELRQLLDQVEKAL